MNNMRNSKGSFYRTGDISREPKQGSDWLEQFAEKMRVQEVVTKKDTPDPEPKTRKTAASKSAVEVARDRQQGPSVFEMMSSIVSAQKPKYSSVEEAVQDYQRRAGLKPVDKLAQLAKQVVQASEEDVGPDTDVKFVPRPPPFVPEKWEETNTFGFFAKYLEGLAKSEDPADRMRAATNYLASKETLLELSEDELEDIRGAAKKTLSEKEDNRFSDLLSDLDAKDDNERCSDKPDTADVRWDSKKKSLVAESDSNAVDDDVCDLITQHPAIETFVKNLIDTNPGIQVPAVLYAITETFGRDGVGQQIFGDKALSKWINKLLMDNSYLQDETPSQLGRGVGISVDYAGPEDGNRNPFLGLTPNRGSF